MVRSSIGPCSLTRSRQNCVSRCIRQRTLQPRQLLPDQGTVWDRWGSGAGGDLPTQADSQEPRGGGGGGGVELAIGEPARGQVRVANELAKRGITVSAASRFPRRDRRRGRGWWSGSGRSEGGRPRYLRDIL